MRRGGLCPPLFYCLSGVFTLIFSAASSLAILLNISWNFGLLVCMRLFEANAMSNASLRFWISSGVNLGIGLLLCSCGSARFDSSDFGVYVNRKVAPPQGACPEDVSPLSSEAQPTLGKPLNLNRRR